MLVHRLVSAAGSVNNTLVSSGITRVHAIYGHNAAAAVRYLKLFNKATAPAAGTDTPYATLHVLASTAIKFEPSSPIILPFGLGYALTTGSADNDTGAVTAADILALNIVYST